MMSLSMHACTVKGGYEALSGNIAEAQTHHNSPISGSRNLRASIAESDFKKKDSNPNGGGTYLPIIWSNPSEGFSGEAKPKETRINNP